MSEDLLHRLGTDWHRPPVLAAGGIDAAVAAAHTTQRADDQAAGIAGWQASPASEQASRGSPATSTADAWLRVRRTLGSG